jgi:predicted aminopeptidase
MKFSPVYISMLLCVCVMTTNGCYLLKQGSTVLKYSTHSVPIKKLLDRPQTSDTLKQFLTLVQKIGRFAVDSIGLVKSRNFSSYVSLNKPHLIDAVCASGAADLTPYTWCYPLLGCWPLRGYFDGQDAQKEATSLAKKGYDVYVGRVDAFSSLGFFSDPVYSFMTRYSPFRMAYLMIHELTHGTVYVKNQVDFSEELATFSGTEGALWFVRSSFGAQSAEYADAVNSAHDNAAYYRLIRSLGATLSAAYADGTMPYEQKIAKKRMIIAGFKDSLARNYGSIFLTRAFVGLDKEEINNAFVSIDMTYSRDLDLFHQLYGAKNHDLRLTMAAIRSIAKKSGSCKENMRKLMLP